MNYLIHLSLSHPRDFLVPGNFICDLMSYKEAKVLPSLFEPGIAFHRWIDHYSNNHNALSTINELFHPVVHKYAPVVTDIIADHLMYNSWNKFMTIPFPEFELYIYNILNNCTSMMPSRIEKLCNRMITHNWLSQYKTIEGLEQVFTRLNNRLKFEADLTTSLPILQQHYEIISTLVNHFYSDCHLEANKWINLQSEKKS